MSKKQKKELRLIIIAGVLFIVLEILTVVPICPQVFNNKWISMGLFTVPYLIVGLNVIKKSIKGIYNKQLLDESFLMVIATVGAYITGEYAEACAVMLFYQVGEFFQQYAVKKSRKSIKDLMDIAPESAFVERKDGSVEEVFPDEVEIDDIIVVKPGEKIPVDGTVISGESMINTAALTGESVPRSVHPGCDIISGCVNGEGLIRLKAAKKYEDSTVARILELVENASEKKAVTENFITRFAIYYTPIVVICALLLAVVPSTVLGNPLSWIYRACTFLVISCPCALVISVPLSFFGGIGAASRNGVLVKGSNYLELLADIEVLVTDKTGTLTKGVFEVNKVEVMPGYTEDEVISVAAVAESMSTHPIAVSIRNYWNLQLVSDDVDNKNKENSAIPGNTANLKLKSDNLIYTLKDIQNITGKGLKATILDADQSEHTVYVGKRQLMIEKAVKGFSDVSSEAGGSTVVYVAKGNKALGIIYISDTIKGEAAKALESVRKEGVKSVVLLTGDDKRVGDYTASVLGIDIVESELLPEEKVAKLEEMINANTGKGKIGYIGDGINDAPVLTRADVGIAMGGIGSDAAIEAADVVVMDDNLMHLGSVMRIARKTTRIAKQNIIFALAVKVGVLILGALGIANMWAAVFADVGVAVICILNAMRMLKNQKEKHQ